MRHKPSFPLTPEQVIRRCREEGHCVMCAGQVLALMACMQELDWNISELADHSHVSRPMISELLALKKVATTDIWSPLAGCFGLKLHAFDLLADFCLEELGFC